MNHSLKSGVFAVLLLVFGLYQPAHSQEKHEEFKNWAELNRFHELIAHTFHPMEEGNFEPVRKKSGELKEAALQLASSRIPSGLDRPEIRSAIKELVIQTQQLDEMIQKKASNEDVSKMLSSVHDSFHKIVGLCSRQEHEEK